MNGLRLGAVARGSAFVGAMVLLVAADPAGCDQGGSPLDQIPICGVSALAPYEDDGRIVGEVVIRCNERVQRINTATISLQRKFADWQTVNSARPNVRLEQATGLGGWTGKVSVPCATGEYRTRGRVEFRSKGQTRASVDTSRSVEDPCG